MHNLVHHEVLTAAGVSFTAGRPPEEQETEFLASDDPWFRPVMVRTGPDGELWVVDMYRYMIEHPGLLPPEGQAELAPYFRLGEDRGRIYRIVRDGATPRSIPRLDTLAGPQLAAALDSPSGWQRDAAQQLLAWSKDAAAIDPLRKLIASGNPLVRLQAFCTLDLMDALGDEDVVAAMADAHPGVRRQAVRLAESCTAKSEAMLTAALKLSDDPDAKVRLQLAGVLGGWTDPRASRALGSLARRRS